MEYQFESIGPMLRYVVLAFLIVFALLLLAAVTVIAALPGSIARRKLHPQADAINICGWVGVPTGILWCIALVWAHLKSGEGSTVELEASTDLTRQIEALESSLARLESLKNEVSK